ncbi:NAD(P)-binding protein [Streptomyces sp. Inha503]|uniref:NAD(P)-binding protein n=1 Tax=Streptomyces sp. Inha503 TaxID=3383314 RepID=UPI00399FA558
MSTTPRIAISGAGLGGLGCARALQQHGVPVTVFERESGSHSRSQGGTLDIHEDTGQAALRAAGLFDQFLALSRPEGQEWRLYDRHATLTCRQRSRVDQGPTKATQGQSTGGKPAGRFPFGAPLCPRQHRVLDARTSRRA